MFCHTTCGRSSPSLSAASYPAFPSVRSIVHRDADYLRADEIAAEGDLYKAQRGHLFATRPLEIEGYFCRLEHLIELNPDHADLLRRIHPEILAECEEVLRAEAVKGRVHLLNKTRKTETQSELQHKATEWAAGLDYRTERWAYGRTFLKRLRERFQRESKRTLVVARVSRFLVDDSFQQLLVRRG
jgi:hypothetical protein